jgi:lysyl-tRNA synthetase class 1
MHWATEVAQNIIDKKPNKKLYTVASGISPSGNVHIGNFREFVTTFFVAKELKNLGKNVRFVFSWDNFDRFRKVPANLDESFSKYIGKAYTDVPSPTGVESSYAEHFQNKFEHELKLMQTDTEFIYQTKEYKSKRYNNSIIEALEKRGEIFDILASYKTQTFTQEQKQAYYPCNVYCSECSKDNTKITSYDSNTNELTYECECGNQTTVDVKQATNIKLHWKIDWPMRWRAENVDFEPGGRDHASETGSYTVSSEIAKKIFNIEPPMFLGYDFIGVKGSNQKVSSSTGNTLVLSDLLNVYDKHIIKWFYAKYKPSAAFDISLDQDVVRYYGEFDRFVKAYFAGRLDGTTNADIIRLTEVTKDYLNTTPFNHLATFMPMVNYNEELLKELMVKEGINVNTANFENRKQKAIYWLDNYADNYKISILQEFNQSYYDELAENAKNNIEKVVELVKKPWDSATDLQNALYAIPIDKTDDDKQKKTKQKQFFKHLYNLITGNNKGPKLGLFLLALGQDKVISLLKK